MTRSVLITGAGGFVGAHLAQGFLAMGDAVTAFDLAFDAPTRARLAGATLIETALTRDTLAKLSKTDLVIHGAAITTPPHEFGLSEHDHVQANVDMLFDCLDFAVRTGASDFAFLSSSGVFDIDDGEGIHLETTPATGAIAYARAKRVGEAATLGANSASMRAISIRLGPVYGTGEVIRDTRNVVSQVQRWLDCAAAGQPIIVQMPDEHRDWTYAADLPHALDALLRRDPALSGVVHLTSADIISNLELAEAVVKLCAGARLVVQPSGGKARLPMASMRIDMPSLYAWTPLATGLAQTAEATR